MRSKPSLWTVQPFPVILPRGASLPALQRIYQHDGGVSFSRLGKIFSSSLRVGPAFVARQLPRARAEAL